MKHPYFDLNEQDTFQEYNEDSANEVRNKLFPFLLAKQARKYPRPVLPGEAGTGLLRTT